MYDCIAAIATASGTGGVAVIRLSGENSLEMQRQGKVFRSKTRAL